MKNEDTLIDRIKMAIEKSGKSAYSISQEMGITRSAISQIINGKTNDIKPRTLVSLAQVTDVSYEWLKLGEVIGKSIKDEFDKKKYYDDAIDVSDYIPKKDKRITENFYIKKLPKGKYACIFIFDSKYKFPMIEALTNV